MTKDRKHQVEERLGRDTPRDGIEREKIGGARNPHMHEDYVRCEDIDVSRFLPGGEGALQSHLTQNYDAKRRCCQITMVQGRTTTHC